MRARLDRIAVIESSGGALSYRLDASRIGQELASGDSASAICAFLERHSTVAVAPAVIRFVHDAERRRSGLTVTAAATVITADGTLGLADALKVKAARLTLIAPTVAISDLPPAKMLAALRAKGLAPRADLAGPSAPTRPLPPIPDVRLARVETASKPSPPFVVHPGTAQLMARLNR